MSVKDRGALERLPREDLVVEARRYGAKRPEVMTRVELVDEILRLVTPSAAARKEVRGWFGVARDLVASMVEQGLNLPDAAAFIRGDVRYEPLRTPQPPVATVTLAEIYGAQGHYKKALAILDEVLEKEPEHGIARRLRDKIARERDERHGDAPQLPPDPVEELPPVDALEDRATPVNGVSAGAALPAPPDEPDAPTVPPPPDPATLPPRASFEPDEPELATLFPPRASEGDDADDSDALTLFPAARGPEPVAEESPVRDAVVLARVGGTRVSLYYERSGRAGPAVVRVVELRPTPSGSERVERDLPAPGPEGTLAVDGIAPASVVRAALGTKRGVAFRASAVAAEVRVAGTAPEVVWMPRTSDDYEGVARRALQAPSFGRLE